MFKNRTQTVIYIQTKMIYKTKLFKDYYLKNLICITHRSPAKEQLLKVLLKTRNFNMYQQRV